MNWKIFIVACVSAAFVLFPQNMIGCAGGDEDAYDYYTSFFHQELPDAVGYHSFYYTSMEFLYDMNEQADIADTLAGEWAAYCGHGVVKKDAYLFMNKFSRTDIKDLYNNIDKKLSESLPDSVSRNTMTTYFTKTADKEALGYILFAKKVEPYVIGSDKDWDAPNPDSVKMSALIKDGIQLYTAAKNEDIKLRYAYQLMRLAHYSGREATTLQLYNDYVATNKTPGILQNLCLSLKAGALFRSHKTVEAAYLFSKTFTATLSKRISDYKSFNWCINEDSSRDPYLQLCKTDLERANLLTLFALGSTGDETSAIQQVYTLSPGADVLQVLAVREINKLEEKYFSPSLKLQKGGRAIYNNYYYDYANPYSTYYNYVDTDGISKAFTEIKPLAQLFNTIAQNKKVKNRGLFETAAAYTSYMAHDYSNAEIFLAKAKKMSFTDKVKDQWQLTRLLVTINEKDSIDAAFEQQLLPSILWLENKAKTEIPTSVSTPYNDQGPITQWMSFYRDLMSEVIAKKYHQQKELYKEALAIGAADYVTNNNGDYSNGILFLRGCMDVKEVEKLYGLMTSTKPSDFDSYLLSHNSITKTAVVDFSGTAYLREYDYADAIRWFNLSNAADDIVGDPFLDLLLDQDESLHADSGKSTSKIEFAKEMQRLMNDVTVNKNNAAKDYYKIATGLYNMTYYGNSGSLVVYDRSATDGYYMPQDATPFQKEYYWCISACNYYMKAYNASLDRNFKARCLFMMAKCSQKQVKNSDDFFPAALNNKYFPMLVKECRQTPFFKEAYTRCSYLKDFVDHR